MSGTPRSVGLTRELLLAFHDAQLEAAAAIGMRGRTATQAMRDEHKRRADKRWSDAVRCARKSETRRVSEDDYRGTLPDDAGRAGTDNVEVDALLSEHGDEASAQPVEAHSEEEE